mgnify:CR=1 FL=1
MKRQLMLILLLGVTFGNISLAQAKMTVKVQPPITKNDTMAVITKPIVTFVELGSVNCIPCKAMQPVMKAVEEKYGAQIKVLFYDVWKKEQAHYAQQYGIRLIPTQVFLDANGKELMRHEGFFPEKEIDVFLQSKGLKPKATGNG